MSKTAEPSDKFMELLTDALRAGPGSPEWHHAVGEIRKQGGAGDEYQMLWTARERLASGREYRSVKAGPGFTRRLLEGIDRLPTGGKTRSAPIATLIAVVSFLVLVGVAVIVGYWIYAPHPPANPPVKEDPSTLVFADTIIDDHFTGDLAAMGWRTIGSLPVVTSQQGLKPGAVPASATDYVGGGVVGQIPLSPGNAFSFEVTLTGHVGGNVVPQLFVTDRPEFSADRGTSAHELVWTVQDGLPQVILPGGRIADGEKGVSVSGATLHVRLIVTRDQVVVTTEGHTLYSGGHELPADRLRYIGVRFLAKAGAKSDLAVSSVRVQKPAPPRL
ncbi:MAG TPA: hypothetical protein VFE58_03110 [Tepidisphaeraceae bacterium]|nr:hypothetical protein [Tepidisphaeraceae bacterium]